VRNLVQLYAPLVIAAVALVVALATDTKPGPRGPAGPAGAVGMRGEQGPTGLRGASARVVGSIEEEVATLSESVRYLCGSLGPAARASAEAALAERVAKARVQRLTQEEKDRAARRKWERTGKKGPPPIALAALFTSPGRGHCES
jgi:hypothetical protein